MSHSPKKITQLMGGLFFSTLYSVSALAVLPSEPIPAVTPLPANYAKSTVFVHDTNFDALTTGRVILVDVATDNHNYKGALDASQFASFIESKRKDELYVSETFYSRGTRGTRTDVLSIYSKENLEHIGEILLPGGKRGQYVSHRYTLQLVDNDRYLLMFNFTPAASVVVIDIDKRKILSETQIPGCALIYPSGKRGFSSLCGNGSMLSVQFDESGKVIFQDQLKPFFSVDADPLFDKPVYVGTTAWFPTFKGDIQAVDLSADKPVIKERWSLLTDKDRSQNWRPGGWQIATINDAGQIFVLMHENGSNGSHKGGGSEVWVFDTVAKKRVNRIKLKNWGISIEVTRGSSPYLVVVNGDMQLDIYDANKGTWDKLIGGTSNTPFNLHSLR